MARESQCILFDWGNTLMRVFPQFNGPMAEWPRVEAMPYARQTLETLHPEWTIALATNAADSEKNQIYKGLRRVGLSGWIDYVFCTREIGYRKPEAGYFKAILETLQLPPQNIIMIGDNLQKDILAANNFGIRSIWYNWRSPLEDQNEMHCTIHDLRDIQSGLDKFNFSWDSSG